MFSDTDALTRFELVQNAVSDSGVTINSYRRTASTDRRGPARFHDVASQTFWQAQHGDSRLPDHADLPHRHAGPADGRPARGDGLVRHGRRALSRRLPPRPRRRLVAERPGSRCARGRSGNASWHGSASLVPADEVAAVLDAFAAKYSDTGGSSPPGVRTHRSSSARTSISRCSLIQPGREGSNRDWL